VDAGLGVRIALHADRLARTFARAGVGLGALAAHGQAAHVADATVALDALQALEVHAEFAAQIAFDDIFAFLDRVNDLGELRLGQILRADGRVNVRAFENLLRVDRADAVNVAERNVNALAGGTSTPMMRAINF
jgi:hypothetical protein